jgi:uncharacterized repeat protein (TIGR03847 family)
MLGGVDGMEKRYKFDELTLLSAVAVGVPGKRTFFLAIGEKEDWVRVWLEKEHLEALALGIEQLLFTLSQENIRFSQDEEGPTLTGVPSGLPSAELEIDQIALGYEQEAATIGILVHESGSPEQQQSEVYSQVTLSQLKELGSQSMAVCAAGRPRCKLCGGPIDPTGHICPKNN